MRRFFREQSGQTTLEYILLLFAAVSFFTILVQLLQPYISTFTQQIASKLQNQFFNGDLHHLNVHQ